MRGAALFLMLALVACGGGGGSPMAPAPPAPASPLAVASPTPAPSPASQVLRTATLRGANGHSASGMARIIRENGGFVLELGEDFRIDSGNNDVYLTRDAGGIVNSDLNLGRMQELTGRQRYALPNDGAAYAHVMLWCRPFRVPIGVGELR